LQLSPNHQRGLPEDKAMKPYSVSIVCCCMLAGACMNEPFDQQVFPNTSSPITVQGGSPTPNQNLYVQAYSFASPRGWSTVASVTTKGSDAPFNVFNTNWYSYDQANLVLESRYWRPAFAGSVAKLRVADGQNNVAKVFRTDEGPCYNAHSSDFQDFLANCSASTPYASLLTSDYDPTPCGTAGIACCQNTWCDDSAGLICVAGACVADPKLNRLQILDSANNLLQQDFIAPGSVAIDTVSSVRGLSRDRLSLGYGVDSPQTLLWFADDPGSRFDKFATQTEGVGSWDANRISSSGTAPVVTAYPPSGIIFYDHNDIFTLPAGNLAFDNPVSHSLSAVFSLSPGSCAYALKPSTDLLSQVVDGISWAFTSQVDTTPATPKVYYQRADMFMRRLNGDVPVGGFIYTGELEVQPPIIADQTCYHTYSYQFGLDHGILNVTPTRHFGTIECSGFGCPADGGACSQLDDGLQNQVPAQLESDALDRQTIPIPTNPSDSKSFQRCNASSDCVAPNAIGDLLSKLVQANPSLNATQQSQLAAKALSPGNWACKDAASDALANTNVCHFVLRAQRVNVLPDEIQLVWEDSLGSDAASPDANGGVLLGAVFNAAAPLMCTASSTIGPLPLTYGHVER
jgi:hypothetical protein